MMFQDEARIGRIDYPKACWAPYPMRPVVGAQLVREYAYLFGAVSPKDGQHDTAIFEKANAGTMSSYLAQVEASHPGELILMVLDGAGWHRAKDLEIPKRVRLAFLPPYSPELNPEEQVWDELREKSLANRVFNAMRRVFGAPYWSLSKWLKLKVKNAVNYIGAFEKALANEAKHHHVDGVICGHIHTAAQHDDFGLRYINCGDWVESCTCIGENDDGTFEIITWTHTGEDSEPAPIPAEARAA